ncbi:MAG: hypothetical protein IT210_19530 [Armatimonadetes bacterium]|nr:hypothetical protein [Armatimonadota bacterium]
MGRRSRLEEMERLVCRHCGKNVMEPGHLERVQQSCLWCIRRQSVARFLKHKRWPAEKSSRI